MIDEDYCDKIVAKINYIFVLILTAILVIFLLLFYHYSKEVYGVIHFKNYLDFVRYVLMPSIVVLPYIAGIISIGKSAENEELKDGILALLSGVLFLCAEILSIIVLVDTARSVINYTPAKFDFLYKLAFLYYPLENSSGIAITIMLL